MWLLRLTNKYCVRSNTGVVLTRSTCDVIVTMQAHEEPADMHCKDTCLLQSVLVIPGTTAKDANTELKDLRNDHRLGPVSENGNTLISKFAAAPRTFAELVDLPDNSSEELLRREANRSHGGIPFMYVVLISLIVIILGFILKRT